MLCSYSGWPFGDATPSIARCWRELAHLYAQPLGAAACSRPRPKLLCSASNGPAPRHKVDDQHNDRNHEQEVDQASSNMESPTQQPENQQNRKNGPKHTRSPRARRAGYVPENQVSETELAGNLNSGEQAGPTAAELTAQEGTRRLYRRFEVTEWFPVGIECHWPTDTPNEACRQRRAASPVTVVRAPWRAECR